MTEPKIQPLVRSESGWDPMIRIYAFGRSVDLSEGVYWLAKYSRENNGACAAAIAGKMVYAWPDQTVDQIIASHLRLLEIESATASRWTIPRKAALITAVRRGLILKDAAVAFFGIGESEWRAWENLVPQAPRHAA